MLSLSYMLGPQDVEGRPAADEDDDDDDEEEE
jgi:hypothetical protein